MRKMSRRKFIGALGAISAPIILGNKATLSHSNEANHLLSDHS